MGKINKEASYYERVYKNKLEIKKIDKELEKLNNSISEEDKKKVLKLNTQKESLLKLIESSKLNKEEKEEKIEISTPPKEAEKKYSLKTSREEQLREFKKDNPEPIHIPYGLTPETAFEIKNENMIDRILQGLFGSKDGQLFIYGQSTTTINNIRYKVILTEDSNGFQYRLWFNITALGYLANLKRLP